MKQNIVHKIRSVFWTKTTKLLLNGKINSFPVRQRTGDLRRRLEERGRRHRVAARTEGPDQRSHRGRGRTRSQKRHRELGGRCRLYL